MSLTIRHAAGLEYLGLITDLLQHFRDQHADPDAATFWIDGSSRTVAAAVITEPSPVRIALEVFVVVRV